MYTILIAEPELYSIGVFKTQEDIKRMKLPGDSLVIEIKKTRIKKKAPKCLGGKDRKRNRVF